MFTRRAFLALGAAAVAVHSALEDTMPNHLDHLVLGCSDLDRGIEWLESRTGIRAARGGVHPGRGTRNALIGLGPKSYLEILAPDPAQASLTWYTQLPALHEPRLVAWAVHTTDLDRIARKCDAAGYEIVGPTDYSRSRPDGKVLRWRLFHLKNDHGGVLPFFIEWAADAIHPATDAPAGLKLLDLRIESPAPEELAKICRNLEVEVAFEKGAQEALRVRIASSTGKLTKLSS